MSSKRRSLATVLVFATLSLGLSGCAESVAIDSAAYANHPDCAKLMVRLPDTIEGMDKRSTNAQSTAAWGKPSRIILRCGLEPVYASILPCITTGGVDWLVDDTKAPSFRFISFGRKPATEIMLDSQNASGVTALEALAPAVAETRATRNCTARPD